MKELLITLGIIILIFIILIGGVYLKHKHDEKELVAQAEKIGEKFIKKKEHSDVEFTDYEFTPMHGLFLYGHLKSNHKNVYVLFYGMEVEDYGSYH
ncbi:hypothetical protein JOD45_000253 [Scopulibacillus daqui]|uniref:DUF3139 domain-containing protein n=1 Tax=Scopulibacillus daqui TaxID=1469162 RepID=A0ABS2PXL0_9BACL|nr:hypothetical protein [Scopulibacillus daqui]MBM7644062.1 hypothetical protein [Scopulibacillus daqui]